MRPVLAPLLPLALSLAGTRGTSWTGKGRE